MREFLVQIEVVDTHICAQIMDERQHTGDHSSPTHTHTHTHTQNVCGYVTEKKLRVHHQDQ
jgi:hypothetical protein